MMICKTCDIQMQSVVEFSKDRHEKFNNPKKHRKLNDNEITFGEVLSKEMYKHKWGNYDNGADNQYIL